MSKYISVTIGPITRVIAMAQKTRGMWAASYLFSYVAKEIIRPFKDRLFLLPFVSTEMFTHKFKGAGVFPDRFIFEAKDNDFDDLKNGIENVFSKLASNIGTTDNDNVEDVKNFLKHTFKVYFVEKERSNIDERTFIEECESTLALLEEQDTFVPSVADGMDYLSNFINGKIKNMKFLMDDAGIGERFKSIVEISSENDTLSSYKEDVEFSHAYERYMAVVYADGDSLTEALKKTKTSDLSKALFEFNKKAIEQITEFEGQAVFVGGDDLFFFAPIFHKEKSIFTLLQSINDLFVDELGEKNISGPTLSFGVSVTYYKYPMSEAVDLSDELLKIAKGKQPLKNSRFNESVFKKKNNLIFSVQKHSGQTRAALLHKGYAKTVALFNSMVDKYARCSNNTDEHMVLSSVMHNLREHEPILANAVCDKNLLKNYFDNNYNESGHLKFKDLMSELADLLNVAYVEYQDAYSALDLTYALLQFIHLINSKRDE